jgi:hypothetical protein
MNRKVIYIALALFVSSGCASNNVKGNVSRLSPVDFTKQLTVDLSSGLDKIIVKGKAKTGSTKNSNYIVIDFIPYSADTKGTLANYKSYCENSKKGVFVQKPLMANTSWEIACVAPSDGVKFSGYIVETQTLTTGSGNRRSSRNHILIGVPKKGAGKEYGKEMFALFKKNSGKWLPAYRSDVIRKLR